MGNEAPENVEQHANETEDLTLLFVTGHLNTMRIKSQAFAFVKAEMRHREIDDIIHPLISPLIQLHEFRREAVIYCVILTSTISS